jgi:hypothetical protein
MVVFLFQLTQFKLFARAGVSTMSTLCWDYDYWWIPRSWRKINAIQTYGTLPTPRPWLALDGTFATVPLTRNSDRCAGRFRVPPEVRWNQAGDHSHAGRKTVTTMKANA